MAMAARTIEQLSIFINGRIIIRVARRLQRPGWPFLQFPASLSEFPMKGQNPNKSSIRQDRLLIRLTRVLITVVGKRGFVKVLFGKRHVGTQEERRLWLPHRSSSMPSNVVWDSCCW